ncbi:MAG: NAD(P)-dependent oxidoreductase [Gemmatimonadales bacterium]|nr:NAD(P)-dependent oxidoreductase [Gemmatimonadales bacterium]
MSDRVVVTGATGFVGSHVAAALAAAGWTVHALVRPESSLATLEARGADVVVHRCAGGPALRDAIASAAPRLVVHLASLFLAEHRPEQVAPLIDANVRYGAEVLEAATAAGCRRVLNTGTTWQHHEGRAHEPVALYAATKTAFEAILAYYVSAEGLAALTLELPDTYGPGDPRGKLVAALRARAGTADALALSPGAQRVDLLHVDDAYAGFLVAADRLCAASGGGHARFRLSGGAPRSLREVVAAAERAFGAPIPVSWGARPYRRREVMEPATVTPLLPGWSPRLTLEAGLATL